MTFAIGFIFSRYFKRKPAHSYDPLEYYKKNQTWEDIKYGAIVAAPAVVLHELAHKFVAIAFGATATLHAPSLFGIPYGMYLFIILLSFLNFPIIFFVGGYVSHTPLQHLPSALVSLAGPLTNFLIWGIIYAVIHFKLTDKKYHHLLIPMGKINLFLGIFNMIPLFGFDGYHFFRSLIAAIV